MTLKEKFEQIFIEDFSSDWEKECEVIADELAIGFAEWYLKISEKYDSYLKLQNDSKKLLEIYKKRKGL